jgi:hypothetical protein
MLKMKSALYIVAIFSLALVACTQRLDVKDVPGDYNGNGATTMVKATVKPLSIEGLDGVGTYKWDGNISLGIYGTSGGANECYLPVKSTAGDSEAYFYGNKVAGDLTIYAPYSAENGERALEGRIAVPAQQKYYADAFDHFMYNSSFLGQTQTEEVEFDYHAGLVKVLIEYDVQDIASVKLMVGNIHEGYSNYIAGELSVIDGMLDVEHDPKSVITVSEFGEGVNSTVANPLVVWVAVAPGIYENLVVEITNMDNLTISSPVAGPFEVSRCALASQECVAKKVDHNNGVDDMLPEDGEFNE